MLISTICVCIMINIMNTLVCSRFRDFTWSGTSISSNSGRSRATNLSRSWARCRRSAQSLGSVTSKAFRACGRAGCNKPSCCLPRIPRAPSQLEEKIIDAYWSWQSARWTYKCWVFRTVWTSKGWFVTRLDYTYPAHKQWSAWKVLLNFPCLMTKEWYNLAVKCSPLLLAWCLRGFCDQMLSKRVRVRTQ